MSLMQSLIKSMVDRTPPHPRGAVDVPSSAKLSRTAQLIYQIEHRPGISTAELARDAALHSSLVWGLLKHARTTGRIEHSAKEGWRISTKKDDQLVQAAAALLKSRGWGLVPPATQRRS